MAAARRRERGTARARHKSRGDGREALAGLAAKQEHRLRHQEGLPQKQKGQGLAHASTTHMEAHEVCFQRESSELTQPSHSQAIQPHLERTVSSSSFSKHLSELFLQVKSPRSKEKSGDRTRRSIQNPHLIKHPIHNRLHQNTLVLVFGNTKPKDCDKLA